MHLESCISLFPIMQCRKKKKTWYCSFAKIWGNKKQTVLFCKRQSRVVGFYEWFIRLRHGKINALSNWLRLFSFVNYWSPPTTSLLSSMILLEVKPMKPHPIYFFLLYAMVSPSITSERPATHLQLVALWQTLARGRLLEVM